MKVSRKEMQTLKISSYWIFVYVILPVKKNKNKVDIIVQKKGKKNKSNYLLVFVSI